MPTESIIRDNQENYYRALEESGAYGESTPFVEFMLEVLLETIRRTSNKVGNQLSENQKKIIENIESNPKISAAKQSAIIGISKRKIEENLAKLKQMKVIQRVGGTRGYWEVLD